MNNIQIEEAARELLREASKSRNQLAKMKNDAGEFVTCRHSYVEPEELRTVYLAAFDWLCLDGRLKKIVENDIMEIYQVDDSNHSGLTVQDAMTALIDGVQRHDQIFKIHGPAGEFLQCGPNVYFSPDHERIVFLEAIYELLHHGKLEIVSDTKKFAVYAASRNRQSVH
jgi:hypothetical protein